MKTRIYIGTTGGPVQIERIWREEGIAESMVCLKRTTEKLPIGAGYDDFVKRPSGIIEREFGPFDPGAFRLDLSDSINQGKSWQLAVFVAHALAREGLLAGPDDPFERAIWLTGQVDNDLKVGAVDHVPEKIHGALAKLAALAKTGKQVLLYVPQENGSALANSNLPRDIEGTAVASAPELLDAIGTPLARRGAANTKPLTDVSTERRPAGLRMKRTLLGVSFLLLGGVAIAAGLILPGELTPDEPAPPVAEVAPEVPIKAKAEPASEPEPEPEPEPVSKAALESAVTEPDTEPVAIVSPQSTTPPALGVTIFTIHPSGNGGCPAVHFGVDDGVTTEIIATSSGYFTSIAGDDLCAIEFKLAPVPGKRYLAAGIELISGRYVETTPMPASLRGDQPIAAPISWRINLPLRMKAPLEYRMHLVSGENPITAGVYRSLRTGIIARDGQIGLNIRTAHHTVAP